MQLNLTDDQVSALITAIDSYYSGLREEIYHTENYDMRQSLKELEASLAQIREQLGPGWMASSRADGAAAGQPATPPPPSPPGNTTT